MFTYKDIATGKVKRTRGRFAGWTEPTGLLRVPYAIFRNPRGDVLVPAYSLTSETKDALPVPGEYDKRKEGRQMRHQQDWELCEEFTRGGELDYETIDVQIPTKREAKKLARKHANKTGNRCWVTTSIAIIDEERNSIEDRLAVEGAEPILIQPSYAVRR